MLGRNTVLTPRDQAARQELAPVRRARVAAAAAFVVDPLLEEAAPFVRGAALDRCACACSFTSLAGQLIVTAALDSAAAHVACSAVLRRRGRAAGRASQVVHDVDELRGTAARSGWFARFVPNRLS